MNILQQWLIEQRQKKGLTLTPLNCECPSVAIYPHFLSLQVQLSFSQFAHTQSICFQIKSGHIINCIYKAST